MMVVSSGNTFGLAVHPDETVFVVSEFGSSTLIVYSLADGKTVRTIGRKGSACGEMDGPFRICFAPNQHLLVAEFGNKRVQQLTITGSHVRFIGDNFFVDGAPWGLAARGDVVAVSKWGGIGHKIALFSFDSGRPLAQFGPSGAREGSLGSQCCGITFSPSGREVVVTENAESRLSVFRLDGAFVQCVGVGELGEGQKDTVFTTSGEYVVSDSDNHRVVVFSADGKSVLRKWGSIGSKSREFNCPTALAVVKTKLYVLDKNNHRVHVFE